MGYLPGDATCECASDVGCTGVGTEANGAEIEVRSAAGREWPTLCGELSA